MKKFKNKQGFSIVIAILLVILISLIAFFILEYMIPFSKNVKGIENSARSYYLANSGVEESLYFINTSNTGEEKSTEFPEPPTGTPAFPTGTRYNITASGPILPPVGQGNSAFDNSWNKIAPSAPIQLDIGNNKVTDWSKVKFYFRVPDFKGNGDTGDNYEGLTGTNPIINWQLSSYSGTLNSTGSWIMVSDINGSQIKFNGGDINGNSVDFGKGVLLDGNEETFTTFYNDTSYGCNSPQSKKCSLKFSIINKLKSSIDGEVITVPYLEWKIDFGPENNVPLRYARIKSEGKAYGFKKTLNISIPQQSVIEAFDFAVFQ